MSTPPGGRREPAAGEHAERRGSADAIPAIDRALRRRLDEVFGEVLPRVTSDERDPGERFGMDAEFYRSNRPPHHDR
jgi:hypothetical protein